MTTKTYILCMDLDYPLIRQCELEDTTIKNLFLTTKKITAGSEPHRMGGHASSGQ
jgi:hypothetical protein